MINIILIIIVVVIIITDFINLFNDYFIVVVFLCVCVL